MRARSSSRNWLSSGTHREAKRRTFTLVTSRAGKIGPRISRSLLFWTCFICFPSPYKEGSSTRLACSSTSSPTPSCFSRSCHPFAVRVVFERGFKRVSWFECCERRGARALFSRARILGCMRTGRARGGWTAARSCCPPRRRPFFWCCAPVTSKLRLPTAARPNGAPSNATAGGPKAAPSHEPQAGRRPRRVNKPQAGRRPRRVNKNDASNPREPAHQCR